MQLDSDHTKGYDTHVVLQTSHQAEACFWPGRAHTKAAGWSLSKKLFVEMADFLAAWRVHTMISPAKLFIFLGLLFVGVGLVLAVAQKVGLGRLPGDIVVKRENFTFSLPLATCIVISAALTLLLWLIGRFRGQ